MTAAAPPQIPGTPTDPPQPAVPALAHKLDATAVGGVAYRAWQRYTHANVGLLAAGTGYYLTLALFSIAAFAYGVIAIVGADDLATRLTESLGEALPGLVGEEGIDPDQLRATGRTAGLVGLLLLLYSGLGAVNGASSSMHLVYGAPPDPRKLPRAKARQLLILVGIAPLIAVSFASVGLTSDLIRPVLEELGLDSGPVRLALSGAGLLVGFGVDLLVVWILLGVLGGIRPDPRPRLVAAAIGAVAIGVVKQLLDVIVSWAVDKPQYGAFAAPLAVLFILMLLAQVLYASAAIAAGIAESAAGRQLT
jgi:membrane protein